MLIIRQTHKIFGQVFQISREVVGIPFCIFGKSNMQCVVSGLEGKKRKKRWLWTKKKSGSRKKKEARVKVNKTSLYTNIQIQYTIVRRKVNGSKVSVCLFSLLCFAFLAGFIGVNGVGGDWWLPANTFYINFVLSQLQSYIFIFI